MNLKIEKYEGPLDLLLALISKNKVDILDIPIAEIADQYMAYIDAMRSLDMEVTSEFIYYAAELMLIKSKMLLPSKNEGEEDPRQNLVDMLLEYARAKRVSEFLSSQSQLYFDRFTREPAETDGIYYKKHAVSLLVTAFEAIKNRITDKPESNIALFQKFEKERFFTVEEKTISVLTRLSSKKTGFNDFFDDVSTRGEAVAVFMAILELLREGKILVEKSNGYIYLDLYNNRKKGRGGDRE